MTEGPPGPVQQLTTEEFVALVFAATDQQIEEGIRAAGTAQVVDRIFAEMTQRFLPERAPGVAAEVQWIITDGEAEHPYRMVIAEGRCTADEGSSGIPGSP